MHVVDGTGVHVKVVLNGGLLGCLCSERASTVTASTLPANEEVKTRLKERVVEVEEHRSDDDVSDSSEPVSAEVRHGATSESKTEGLLAHIGIDEEQKEGRVEDLHEEGDVRGFGELDGLSVESNPVNEHDADSSEDIVDSDKNVRKSGSP